MKLYVTQGENKKAVAELWALLRSCSDQREEIRWLRYVLRLGEKSPAAEKRRQKLLGPQQSEPLKMSVELLELLRSPYGRASRVQVYPDLGVSFTTRAQDGRKIQYVEVFQPLATLPVALRRLLPWLLPWPVAPSCFASARNRCW